MARAFAIGISGAAGTYRTPIFARLSFAVLTYLLALLSVQRPGSSSTRAPSFGGEKNRTQAMKCAVYAHARAGSAAPSSSVAVHPGRDRRAVWPVFALSGLPVLMKLPKDKA
jgi:hypothetical protein